MEKALSGETLENPEGFSARKVAGDDQESQSEKRALDLLRSFIA
jgi:hypothetical protein